MAQEQISNRKREKNVLPDNHDIVRRHFAASTETVATDKVWRTDASKMMMMIGDCTLTLHIDDTEQ